MTEFSPINDLFDVYSAERGAPAEVNAAIVFLRTLIAGPNVTLTPNVNGTMTIAASGGGGDPVAANLTAQIFAANNTYTPTPGTTKILVIAVGGGGAGGNGVGSASGGGGGSGGLAMYLGAPSVQAISIGAGGVPNVAYGADVQGGQGGTTSFGALAIAAGGKGGATSSYGAFVGIGGAGGAASAGNIAQVKGNSGEMADELGGGHGAGSAFFGGGGRGGNPSSHSSVVGLDGVYGGGGGGSFAGVTNPGGEGGDGFVLVIEFAGS